MLYLYQMHPLPYKRRQLLLLPGWCYSTAGWVQTAPCSHWAGQSAAEL